LEAQNSELKAERLRTKDREKLGSWEEKGEKPNS